jgi:hypothetical protein
MLATTTTTEHYPYFHPDHAAQPLEVHRTKISLHHAKAGYDYPAIRLPFTFSALVGLSTHIYQTVYDGALAFLVVVSKGISKENSAEISENVKIDAKMPALTWRRSPVRIRPSPSFFLHSEALEPSIGHLSEAIIVSKKEHNKDKKLHNSHELDLSWQETVDLLPEDEVEGGSEIYYFTDEDGNVINR